MTERQIEVLQVFADAGAHDRVLMRGEGRWRQWTTPIVGKAAEVKRNDLLNTIRRRAPAVRSQLNQQAKVERERAQVVRDVMTPDQLGRARVLCGECKKRLPGQGWCPAHTEKKMSERERLPDERSGVTHKFTIYAKDAEGEGLQEVKGYITTGCYPDGRLGEVFVQMGKAGSSDAWLDQWAIAVSLNLQMGLPVREVMKKFLGTRFEPSGGTPNKDIPRCTSLLDYVARFLIRTYDPEFYQSIAATAGGAP